MDSWHFGGIRSFFTSGWSCWSCWAAMHAEYAELPRLCVQIAANLVEVHGTIWPMTSPCLTPGEVDACQAHSRLLHPEVCDVWLVDRRAWHEWCRTSSRHLTRNGKGMRRGGLAQDQPQNNTTRSDAAHQHAMRHLTLLHMLLVREWKWCFMLCSPCFSFCSLFCTDRWPRTCHRSKAVAHGASCNAAWHHRFLFR